MEHSSLRNTVALAVAGTLFLLAGFRDRFWPGHLTFNRAAPSRQEIGAALMLGLFFLGAAAFRLIRSKPQT